MENKTLEQYAIERIEKLEEKNQTLKSEKANLEDMLSAKAQTLLAFDAIIKQLEIKEYSSFWSVSGTIDRNKAESSIENLLKLTIQDRHSPDDKPTEAAKTENAIGSVLDVVTDKNGSKWEIIKLHEGIAGFRDCPFCARFDENGSTNVYEDATIKKAIEEWCDENMTPEQRERYGKPFLASLYQIKGEKALKFVKKSEGEVQFDYYKDPHNQIKMCPDYWGGNEYDYVGAPYWTSSPNADSTYNVRNVYYNGSMNSNLAYSDRGVAPCFAIINNPVSVETAARPSGTETKKSSKKAKVAK